MSGVKIPKIFIQEWIEFPNSRGKYKSKSVPDHWKSSPKSIKKYMSDWKYVLIDNKKADKLVRDYFPNFLETYNSLEYPIMKVDAIRYMWLFVHGGIYMDLDIELVKPIDCFFKKDADIYVVNSGNVGSVYTNAILASKPGCRIWLDCLKEIKKPYKYWMIGKHLKVMGKTGPLMLTKVLNENKHNCKIRVIPKKYLVPCSVCDPKPCYKEGSYTKILEGSSWCGVDTFIYTGCMCNWKKILIFIVVLIVLVFIFIYALS